MKTFQEHRVDPEYSMINDAILSGLCGYAIHHYKVGDFLTAVLSNDLFGAAGRADSQNQRVLPEICKFIYNNLPNNSWGSPEIVKEWLKNDKRTTTSDS